MMPSIIQEILCTDKFLDHLEFMLQDEKIHECVVKEHGLLLTSIRTEVREYQGEIGDASRKIFQASWIHRLTLHRPVPVPENVDMLFLTSDPAQGGDCEWSTVGAYYDRISGCMVICRWCTAAAT